MNPDTSIIICTEQGPLESKAKLLITSIREFSGAFRHVPIYSYEPRKNFRISSSTKAFFEKYEVNCIDLNLNQKF